MFQKSCGSERGYGQVGKVEVVEGTSIKVYRLFFCLTVPKNFVRKEKMPSLLCFGKSPLAKKFLDKREEVGGSIKKAFQIMLSQSAGKFRRETFCVSEKLFYRKIL